MRIRLAERPPEGMLKFVREENEGWPDFLIYRAAWSKEPMTGLSEKTAECRCTRCGSRMQLGRDYGKSDRSVTFGVCWYDREGRHSARNYEGLRCPECAAEVQLIHRSCIGKAQRFAWIMTAEKQGEIFLLYFWRICRSVSKEGELSWSACPWEAYSFQGGKCQRHSHGMRFMSGVSITPEWRSLSGFRDEIREIDRVYCPEGLDAVARGTEMENSKLEKYMAVRGEWRFPVTWCRIYQKHHQAETLMTGPMAKVVAGMIAREKKENLRSSWGYVTEEWSSRTDLLRELDWKKKRPHQILRIEKAEQQYFVEKEEEDGAERLLALNRQIKAGFPCRPGEEAPNLEIGDYDRAAQRGLTPGKVDRYLCRQKQKYPGRANGKSTLWDYWRMAEQQGIDLTDPEELLPQNLERAHDLCVKRQKAQAVKAREEGFRKQYETLEGFAWERDGILIRPARTEDELISEGKVLHHCVASYAEAVSAGRTAIFFIRKTEAPDKPWFTLELDVKGRKVRQNRGLRNCDRTPEVEQFENAWLQWLRTGRKEKGNAA